MYFTVTFLDRRREDMEISAAYTELDVNRPCFFCIARIQREEFQKVVGQLLWTTSKATASRLK